MPIKNNKSNQAPNLNEIEKRVNKLTTRLWAGTFILLIVILAGGFFIFSGMNFKMIAQALSGNYNKGTGAGQSNILTADEWNNLDDDFGITSNSATQVLANNTVYQNNTGYKLIVVAFGNAAEGLVDIEGYIGSTDQPNNLVVSDSGGATGIAQRKSITFVVPAGWFYKVRLTGGALTANAWEM
jgi:hypothetical protein